MSLLRNLLLLPGSYEVARGSTDTLPVIEERLSNRMKRLESGEVNEVTVEDGEIFATIEDPNVPSRQRTSILDNTALRMTALAVIVRKALSSGVNDAYALSGIQGSRLTGTEFILQERDTRWRLRLTDKTLDFVEARYREQLAPTVESILDRKIVQLQASDNPEQARVILGRQLAKELSTEIKKRQSYWDGVAANAIQTAQNIARISAMDQAGIQGYRIVAIIDGRTSRICRDLNGRVFFVGDAINRIEAGLEPGGGLDTAFPWFTSGRSGAAQNIATSNLPPGIFPPYHSHCRTEVVPFIPGQAQFKAGTFAGDLEASGKSLNPEILGEPTDDAVFTAQDWNKRAREERLGLINGITTGFRSSIQGEDRVILKNPDTVETGFVPQFNRSGRNTGLKDRVWRFRKGGRDLFVDERTGARPPTSEDLATLVRVVN